jgi:ATP-dependent Clp protease adaptor protein ClpS
MSATPRIAAAVEDLLQDLFRAARDEQRPRITLEHLLAALLDQPGVAAFLYASLERENRAALRTALEDMLRREAALPERPGPSLGGSVRKMLKSLARIGLPRIVPHTAPEVEHVLMRALLRVAPPKSVEDTDLLLSILDNSAGAAREVLTRHGVSRYALVCYLTNAAYPLPAAAPGGPPNETAAVQLFLLNDDFTPMEFVVTVLQTVFAKSAAEAHALMQEVHCHGRAACGTFPWPVAKERLHQVEQLAAGQQHPLRAVLAALDQDDALMA